MSVSFQTDGPVAILTLDRPERRNAVDRATASALRDGYHHFAGDDALRVLVLATGDPRAFSAGADLVALDNDVDHPDGPMGFTRVRPSKPTIAAIEGYCVAGGLEIALWCDLRVAGRSASFGCLERRFGVPLIDGGTQRLAPIVGLGRALDLVLTGRLIDVVEAERMGLVSRIVDDGSARDAAVALAREIAGFPWSCVLADRESLLDSTELDLGEGLRREAARGRALLTEAAVGAARFASGRGRHGEGT
ncbi:MAG: crotonase/enoyl-CoA hydratase family protein [Polyangiaceae bacterium]|nr:crotonase/enoyl-CoA hydratase family protein [Polyangiaceae bacterium]